MIKLTVLVEISVADNVAELYPNYSINYDDEEQFIDTLIDGIETESERWGLPVNHLKEYGYSIRVLSRDEAKLINL
jgi:hypothetical protein